MKEEQERKNRLIALFSTTGIHGIILLLMFFIIAWKAPNPPLGEAGVDLNIGLDFEGSGDVQPEEPVGGTNQAKIEKVEENKPEPQQPIEEVKETVKPVEAKVEEEKVATGNDEESPIAVKEKKEKKEEVKPVEKPKEKVEEKPIAVYKPNVSAAKTDDEKSNQNGKPGKPGSQGDDLNKTGDKGDPQGTVDGKAMYGKPGNGGGGSGGSSLEIAGWQWDEKPSPNVPANESGRVVFEIKVDDNGDVISIKTLERSISAEAEQACKKAVEKLTFTKTGVNVPSISTGKVTFVVRSR